LLRGFSKEFFMPLDSGGFDEDFSFLSSVFRKVQAEHEDGDENDFKGGSDGCKAIENRG
jgi:hypothetical protein